MVVAGLPARAEDQPSAQAKSEAIKDLLRSSRLFSLLSFLTENGAELERPYPWVTWCEQFLADFREQRGIEYVEPMARSQRYDDPVFRPWQDRCPVLAFNARSLPGLILHGDSDRAKWLRSLPPHMPDGSPFLDYQYGTRDFQLFEGDFDNDDDDDGSEEVIFFSDSFYSYWELIARDRRFPLTSPPLDRSWNDVMPPQDVPDDLRSLPAAEYRLLDLGHCRTKTLASVNSLRDKQGEIVPGAFGGLIKYRDRYYVLDFYSGGPDDHITLEAIKPQREPTNGHPVEMPAPPYCWFLPQ